MGLSAKGLQKRYGAHLVLDVDRFDLEPGEVVAVLGENGAGKSTLAKCLAGVQRLDRGTISIDRSVASIATPRAAAQAGIAFVPQELAEVPDLSAAENIMLGNWPSRLGLVSQRRVRRCAQQQLDRFGVELDLRSRMGELRLGDRQVVEICKVLGRRAPYVVLDEPTAALDRTEADRLFAIVRRLAEQGVGVVFISHRLDEIGRFSDRVDVMRDGRIVASLATRSTTGAELIDLMLGGESVRRSIRRPSERTDRPELQLGSWTTRGPIRLDGLDLTVSAGEIVGIFGVRGSGADVVAEGLAGRRRDISGELLVGGRRIQMFRGPRTAMRHGVSSIPSDRKHSGLVLGLSIAANVGLGMPSQVSRAGVMSRRRELRSAEAVIARYDVRCAGARQPVWQLSGGNQQKVLLAARLASDPRVLIAHEPTRGVDIGARAQVHELLKRRAEQGAAVLLISTDVDEVVSVSHRVIVLLDGAVAGILIGDGVTQAAAIALATRAHKMHPAPA